MIKTNFLRFLALSLVLLIGTNTIGIAQPSASDQEQIVVLGGSITEIVYALGEEDQIKGVDQTSIFPSEAKSLEQVGYYRNISSEGILSLSPTMVIALEGAGPQTALEQLEAAGISLHIIPNSQTVTGAKAKIRAVASLLDVVDRGEKLIHQLEASLKKAEESQPEFNQAPRVLFVYARGAGSMNIAGKETAADELIRLAGGKNVVTEFSKYRPMSAEAVVAAAPDVILLLDHGLQGIGGVDAFLKTPGVMLTPAGKNKRIISMDGLLALGFGPRLGEAVTELQLLLLDSAQ